MDYTNLKAEVMAEVDCEQEFTMMFDGWKPWNNVSCAVAGEGHEDSEDRNESMQLNPEGLAYCHACGYKAMTPIDLYADLHGMPFEKALAHYYKEFRPTVREDVILLAHRKLLRSPVALANLEGQRGITELTVRAHKLGWDGRLTIPIQNEVGLYPNVRRYDLFGVSGGKAKTISWKKGFGTKRLWPLSTLVHDRILMCEGEMDALLLGQKGFPAMTVTGGAKAWNNDWNISFTGKHVVFIPDNDRAGYEGVEKKAEVLRQVARISILKLPRLKEKKDDVTDWFVKYKGTSRELNALLKELDKKVPAKKKVVTSKAPELKPMQFPKEDLFADHLTDKEKVLVNRAERAFGYIDERGAFFTNQNGELYYAQDRGEAMPISIRSQRFLTMMARISPLINPAVSTGKFIIQHIINCATSKSASSRSGSWSMYTSKGIYLASAKGELARVESGGTITFMKNAVNEDKILLESPVKSAPNIREECGPAEAVELLWTRVMSNMALRDEDRYLLICWVLGMFFKEYLRPKPIVRLLAKTATGKSTASKLLSHFFYGEELMHHSASTVAAMYAMAAQFPLLIFDNLETRNMTPKIEDFMLIAATGGTKAKRKLSTDAGVIVEHTNCMVLTNGIEPFNKRELIDRTIELQLDLGRHGSKTYHEVKVIQQIHEDRGRIMHGLLRLFGEEVIPRIKDGEVKRIGTEFHRHAKSRFNEYLALISLILDAIWKYRPLKGYARPHDLVNRWLADQSVAEEEQDAGTNDVLYFLDTLVERRVNLLDARTKVKEENGITMVRAATATLLSDFRLVAKHLGIKCPWTNERQLGTRLADSEDVLNKAGWTREAVFNSGKRLYRFIKETHGGKEEEKDQDKAPQARAVGTGGMSKKKRVRTVDVAARKKATPKGKVRGVRNRPGPKKPKGRR